MKRILLPAGGAILATGLLAAGLAGSASAATPDWVYDTMAKDIPAAAAVADFWTEVNQDTNNLAKATAYNWETKGVGRLKATGGYTPDSKPGIVAPIGEEKKTSAKVKNINLPKTIGKVFFVNPEGDLSWCSATSIQGAHKNLVATAGHCVYDDQRNASVMDNWVFVPGYYQGKTPWGIYVGKTAYTHYDFSAFNDSDRDYAFVTVYNGVQVGGLSKRVTKAYYLGYQGTKEASKVEISEATYLKGAGDPNNDYTSEGGSAVENVDAGYPGAVVTKVEVDAEAYGKAAKNTKANGAQYGAPEVVSVTQAEWEAYKKGKDAESSKPSAAAKSAPAESTPPVTEGPGSGEPLPTSSPTVTPSPSETSTPPSGPKKFPGDVSDTAGVYTITHYYVQQWVKPAKGAKYYSTRYYIASGLDRKSNV